MLQKKFNSLQHQAQARTYLKALTIEGVKQEKSCSSVTALEIINERILKIGPSCGKSYQEDTHRQDFLVSAVEGESEWPDQVLQLRLTPSNES